MAENNEIQNDPTQETVVLTERSTGEKIVDALKYGAAGVAVTGGVIAANALLSEGAGEGVEAAQESIAPAAEAADAGAAVTDAVAPTLEAAAAAAEAPVTDAVAPTLEAAAAAAEAPVTDTILQPNELSEVPVTSTETGPELRPNQPEQTAATAEAPKQEATAEATPPAAPTESTVMKALDEHKGIMLGAAAGAGVGSWANKIQAQRQAMDTSRSMGA